MQPFGESRASLRLAAMAAFLVAGARSAFTVPECAGLWPVFAYIAATAFLAAWGWGVRGLLFPAMFALGALSAFRADDARACAIASGTMLRGDRPPLVLTVEGGVTEWRRGRKKTRYASFATHAGPLPIKVAMPLRDGAPLPQIGERWQCPGWISARPQRRFSPHTLWVASGDGRAERISAAPAWSPSAIYAACSDELSRRAGAGLGWCEELADFNRAILLGSRNVLTKERRDMFAAAGTIHVFAISGLHVMAVAWLISSVLRRFDVPLRARGLVAIPILAAYTMLTGARPSAIRAATMASLCLLAPSVGRRPNQLAALSITAMATYGFWPEKIFDVGCTLSFAVMLGIVLCSGALRNLASPHGSDETTRWHPLEWHEGIRVFARRLLCSFCISTAAWAASVPVTACVFGRFTVGGLLANVALTACTGKMVKAGAAGLMASFVSLPLGALLNNVAAGLTNLMVGVSEWTAKFPWSSIEVRPWKAWECVAWYATWLAVLAALCHRHRRGILRTRPWFATFFVLFHRPS